MKKPTGSNTMPRLQSFDLKLRIITPRSGRFFTQPGEFTHNDIALRAEEEEGRRHPELTYEGAMSAFKAICEHRPARRAAAA